MKYKGSRFTERFDANSYLYITKAMDYCDLSNGYHNVAAAFARSTRVLFLVVSFTSDWLYPTYHSKELVSALTAAGADVSYCNLQSTWGHDAFLLEVETMTSLIGNFLDRVVNEAGMALPSPCAPSTPLSPAGNASLWTINPKAQPKCAPTCARSPNSSGPPSGSSIWDAGMEPF